eukprot:scaffold742_cov263-Pinguiococcus_pyrenoidosus.AAC.19
MKTRHVRQLVDLGQLTQRSVAAASLARRQGAELLAVFWWELTMPAGFVVGVLPCDWSASAPFPSEGTGTEVARFSNLLLGWSIRECEGRHDPIQCRLEALALLKLRLQRLHGERDDGRRLRGVTLPHHGEHRLQVPLGLSRLRHGVVEQIRLVAIHRLGAEHLAWRKSLQNTQQKQLERPLQRAHKAEQTPAPFKLSGRMNCATSLMVPKLPKLV